MRMVMVIIANDDYRKHVNIYTVEIIICICHFVHTKNITGNM